MLRLKGSGARDQALTTARPLRERGAEPLLPHGWKHATLPAHRNSQAGSTGPHFSLPPQSASLWQMGLGLVQTAKSQHRQLWSSISVQASLELHPWGMLQATPGAPHLGSGGPQNCLAGAHAPEAAKAGTRMELRSASTTRRPSPPRSS